MTGRRAGLLAAAAGVVVVILRGALVVVTVRGSSMAPGLAAGATVLIRRRPRAALRVGAVVLFPEPGRPGWVIKRVAATAGGTVPEAVRDAVSGAGVVPPGMLVVLGDNSAQSTDSRHWGFVRADAVLGVVVRGSR